LAVRPDGSDMSSTTKSSTASRTTCGQDATHVSQTSGRQRVSRRVRVCACIAAHCGCSLRHPPPSNSPCCSARGRCPARWSARHRGSCSAARPRSRAARAPARHS
jgi:hypothetical protein